MFQDELANKKVKTVTFNQAQNLNMSSITAENGGTNAKPSEFFSGVFEQFDDIKKGDKVRIVGKDTYKGHIGHVERLYTTQHNEMMFVVELQSNGDMIDRPKSSIKRCYN